MFEILEHPADIGFRVRGASLAELFGNAAIAMLSIAGTPEQATPRLEYPLTAEGSDSESLLVNWLNEVLCWFDGKRVAFHEFRITHLDRERVDAVGLGEPREEHRHTARLIVKAVTYHQLKIACVENGWCAEVYLDI